MIIKKYRHGLLIFQGIMILLLASWTIAQQQFAGAQQGQQFGQAQQFGGAQVGNAQQLGQAQFGQAQQLGQAQFGRAQQVGQGFAGNPQFAAQQRFGQPQQQNFAQARGQSGSQIAQAQVNFANNQQQVFQGVLGGNNVPSQAAARFSTQGFGAQNLGGINTQQFGPTRAQQVQAGSASINQQYTQQQIGNRYGTQTAEAIRQNAQTTHLNAERFSQTQNELQRTATIARVQGERRESPRIVQQEGQGLPNAGIDAPAPSANPLDPSSPAVNLAGVQANLAAQSTVVGGEATVAATGVATTGVAQVAPVATTTAQVATVRPGVTTATVVPGAPVVKTAVVPGAPRIVKTVTNVPIQHPPTVLTKRTIVESGPRPAPFNGIEAANIKAHSVHNSHAWGLGANQNVLTPSSSRYFQKRAYEDMASKAVPSVFGAGVFTQINTPSPPHPHGAGGYSGAFQGVKKAQHHLMASSLAQPIHKGPFTLNQQSNKGISNMFSNDVCSGYDIYQCKKFVYCHWYENSCRMVKSGTGAIYNSATYKTGATSSKSISPFVVSQTLTQFGDAIVNAVSEVDLCYSLTTFYTCNEFFGCSWDGRYCVSSAVTNDYFRDPCADYANADVCSRNNKCTWQPESLRCLSHVGASAHAFPLSNRYRSRIQILGEGFANQFQVKMSESRYQSDSVQDLRRRASEFFLTQYGLDFRDDDEYFGAVMTASKNNDVLFFQVINAEMPYGASLIPRRNRVIFDKFIVHTKPSHATVLRGDFAKYFLKYSVPLYPSEVLEYGALHIIDENDKVVLSTDYFYNYPLRPNPVGLVGLQAEVVSSFGYGMMRGTDVVTPTYDGFVHVDSFYSIIIGSGDANKGSILSTGVAGLQMHGQFTASGRGTGPHGNIHGKIDNKGMPVVPDQNQRGPHYFGGDTYGPYQSGGAAYGFSTSPQTTVGRGDLSTRTGPFNPFNSQIQYSMANQARGYAGPSKAPTGVSNYPVPRR